MHAHRVKTLTPSLKKPGHMVTGKRIKDQVLSTWVRWSPLQLLTEATMVGRQAQINK